MKKILSQSILGLFFLFIFSILFAPTSYANREINIDSITNGQIEWHLTNPESFDQGRGRVCNTESPDTGLVSSNYPDGDIYYPFLTCDDNGATFSEFEGGFPDGLYWVVVRTTPSNSSWTSESFYLYNGTVYPYVSVDTGTTSVSATVTEENGTATVYPSDFTGAFASLDTSHVCKYYFFPVESSTGISSPEIKTDSCGATSISFTWDNPGFDAYVTNRQYKLYVSDYDTGGISKWLSGDVSLTLE